MKKENINSIELQAEPISDNNLVANATSCDDKKGNSHVGHRDRMREKFANDLDFDNFSKHEMIEFLLFAGVPYKNTNDLAHELMLTFGSFDAVFLATPQDLKKVKGMTVNSANTIAAVVPIARWVATERQKVTHYLENYKKSVDYFATFFTNRNYEVIFMCSLDINDRIIQTNEISRGTANFSMLNIKDVVTTACRNNAVKVVLGHNHPAGNLEPSEQDIIATNALVVALSSVGILLLDHLIFTASGNVSLNERNCIENALLGCDKMLGTNLVAEFRQRKGGIRINRALYEEQNKPKN